VIAEKLVWGDIYFDAEVAEVEKGRWGSTTGETTDKVT
jgi:hypothetical protein